MSKPESGRMTCREHPDRPAAIREAMKHGYIPIHRSDGLLVFSNGKQKIAVQRETRPRSVVFHLVAAPPVFVTSNEVAAERIAIEAAA